MTTLSPASAAAIARLRAYRPPPAIYNSLPLSRRAAVLILLFADRRGDLRVVLTMRSSTLKSYAGQAALPGGKADSLAETPFQTARREAYEEIGLPLVDAKLPHPYRVEHLCQLPTNLAKTELGVRPCVAFLSPTRPDPSAPPPTPPSSTASQKPPLDPESLLIPRLSANEVAAVFTAPFHNFLLARDESDPSPASSSSHYSSAPASSFPGHEAAGFPADWYKGTWTAWHESRWRMHNFYIPVAGRQVTFSKALLDANHSSPSNPSSSPSTTSGAAQDGESEGEAGSASLTTAPRFRVFGMTARILVDCARVAYAQEPEFEHNSHFGDEDMIRRLLAVGRLPAERRRGSELQREDLRRAAGAKL